MFVCRKVTGENISFDLYSAESSTPRYTLHVVDSNKRLGNKFAIFIVPEGRWGSHFCFETSSENMTYSTYDSWFCGTWFIVGFIIYFIIIY